MTNNENKELKALEALEDASADALKKIYLHANGVVADMKTYIKAKKPFITFSPLQLVGFETIRNHVKRLKRIEKNPCNEIPLSEPQPLSQASIDIIQGNVLSSFMSHSDHLLTNPVNKARLESAIESSLRGETTKMTWAEVKAWIIKESQQILHESD